MEKKPSICIIKIFVYKIVICVHKTKALKKYAGPTANIFSLKKNCSNVTWLQILKTLQKSPIRKVLLVSQTAWRLVNLIFKNGLLSRRRINSLNSPVIQNIKKGMDFFEKWCCSHEETGILPHWRK